MDWISPLLTYPFILTAFKLSSMASYSPASTPSTEAWESDSQDEHGFGYPLRRMVPLENVQFGNEEPAPGGLVRGPELYRMPASQSSSTSSHMFFV